jgi:hypothetical protein
MSFTYAEIAEDLEGGADFLETHKLTQSCLARHANGRPIGPLEANADSFCAIGAVVASRREGLLSVELDFFENFSHSVGGASLTELNDHVFRTKKEVQTYMRRMAYVARLRARKVAA